MLLQVRLDDGQVKLALVKSDQIVESAGGGFRRAAKALPIDSVDDFADRARRGKIATIQIT